MRAKILSGIRSFFNARGFLEIETPTLVPCPGMDHDFYSRCEGCKPTMRLNFLVRDPNEPRQLERAESAAIAV